MTRPVGPPSVRKTPFHGFRSTQPPPSSSSFNATPRFQQSTPRIQDDIQTSFEDDEATPALPKSTHGLEDHPTSLLDIANDGDDEHTTSPLFNRLGKTGQDDIEHDEIGSSPLQHRQRPLAPVSKRRKVSHPQDSDNIDSPPPDEPLLDDTDHRFDDGIPTSDSDLEDELGLRSTRLVHDGTSRTARFKPLNAEDTRPSALPRTLFRPIQGGVQEQASGGPALPDIFSPSRRKGKKDYVQGGNADTVRNWILGIATQESRSESLDEAIVSITEVSNDSSGRFAVATDNCGSRWLLPEQQKGGAAPKSSLCPGARILVKGRATRWPIHLSLDASDSLTVAAYWEVVSPG